MIKRKYLLQKNKSYFFCIIYGIDIDTVLRLNYEIFGLRAVKVFSSEFDFLNSQLGNFANILDEEFNLFKHYYAHETSLAFISEKKEDFNLFFDFLILLFPSKIDIWLTFSTTYFEYENNGKKIGEHCTGGLSIWKSIHQLYDQLLVEDIFYLNRTDTLFANKIIRLYRIQSKNPSYQKFIGLYRRSYSEEKQFFKYLLLFMMIESLIVDSETTGVVYKIRRLCAVIIGSTMEDCELIFNKTKDAYSVRSKLVHSAKDEIGKARYLPFVHSLVSELGIMILLCNLNIDELFNISNKLGFTQKKQLIKNKSLKSFKNFQRNKSNFHLLEKKKNLGI